MQQKIMYFQKQISLNMRVFSSRTSLWGKSFAKMLIVVDQMHQSQLGSLFTQKEIQNILVIRCFAFAISRRRTFVGKPRSPRNVLVSHAEFIRLLDQRFVRFHFLNIVERARLEDVHFYIGIDEMHNNVNTQSTQQLEFRYHLHHEYSTLKQR